MADKQKNSVVPFPERKDSKPASTKSENQADGTAADRPRGETQAHAAQFNKGLADDTSSGKVNAKNGTPENRGGKIDPSSPTNSTEGGTTRMPQNPTTDSAGEIGEPTGKGTMSMKDETMNKDNKQQGNKDFDKDKKQGQQAQGQNQGNQNKQGSQPNMAGSSDRQDKDNQKSGNQAGKDGNVDRQTQGQDDKNVAGQDQKKAGKSSEHMDEDNNQGDRKTA